MNLKSKTISGVSWNALGNVIRQIVTVLTLIFMARILSPDDYGVYAILMIFVSFMAIFASMGLGQAIIYKDSPSQSFLSSIFYFNLGLNSILSILLFLLASLIASFFDKDGLEELVELISIIFIISSLSLINKTMLEKQMKFKLVVIVEIIALLASALIGLVSAYQQFGVYSLVIMAITNAFVLSTGFLIVYKWLPSLSFSFSHIQTILSYSANLTGFTFINYFSRQSDQFLIGKFLGSTSLGIYSMAYKIMLYPLQNISHVIIRVLFPAFSEIKNDHEKFREGYLKAISFIALITFPLMAGLLVTAESFVSLVLGPQWQEMAILLMVLAPVGMVQSITTTTGSIYMAKGTTGAMFRIGLANAVVTVSAFAIGVFFGLVGIVLAYAIANLIMLIPNFYYPWKQIKLSVIEGLLRLFPFFITSMLMAAFVYLVGIYVNHLEFSIFIGFILQVILGAVFYLVSLYLFYRKILLHLLYQFKRV
ncbi:lipopolysaccharide biosynthesis protein [Thiosulfatimonas sediminis]|uniref:Lipopolysaccharide biosynthesis protein n=1 Tax=Thiosulfatimonas sediminis TaxID=2675054 RepID=A0A6F8PTA9_9GAMM|nr:MOP flippase family protein [Thiosulfatimonas sediminis]BBP45267.1 lipopolysaccharide biosynthesis protein [Thiosulfatimonas sediminis]